MVAHLTCSKRMDITKQIQDDSNLFPDVPKQTGIIQHDVEVGNATPIKQCPNRINSQKAKIMHQDVEYMLDYGIIEPSQSK